MPLTIPLYRRPRLSVARCEFACGGTVSLTAQTETEAAAHDESGMSSEIVVESFYRIEPDSPLTELDRPGAPAYAARDRRNPGRQLFANICDLPAHTTEFLVASVLGPLSLTLALMSRRGQALGTGRADCRRLNGTNRQLFQATVSSASRTVSIL